MDVVNGAAFERDSNATKTAGSSRDAVGLPVAFVMVRGKREVCLASTT
jgi:hypothetical protein